MHANTDNHWQTINVPLLFLEAAKVEKAINASGLPGTKVRIPSNHPDFKVKLVGVGLHAAGIKVKFIKILNQFFSEETKC